MRVNRNVNNQIIARCVLGIKSSLRVILTSGFLVVKL